MVSRENRVQLAAMGIAIVVLIAAAYVVPDDPSPVWMAAFVLVFYSIAFGGAHLYLYLRGEGGSVPRSARGRFLVALGIVLPLWASAIAFQGDALGSVGLTMLLGAISLLILLAYFVNEMWLGYAQFESTDGSR